jgi:NADPH:quinone reductase-like Zn-dependent oxidoreductase
MAKSLGATVAGTASAENRDFVLSLGASQHINYKKEKFEEMLHDFDFVLDTIGGDYIDRSLKILKPGGTIVCIPSGSSENIVEKAARSGMKGLRFMVHSNGAEMKEIAGLLESGEVRPYILKEYAFSEIQDAHLQIETGATRGKIVVIP